MPPSGKIVAATRWGTARTTASASTCSPSTTTPVIVFGPLSATSTASTLARRRIDPPSRSRSAAAGSTWSASSGTRAQPTSAASVRSMSPVRKTFAPSVNDASSARRFTVGSVMRSQSRSIAPRDCPLRARNAANVSESRPGSSRLSLRRARTARATRRPFAERQVPVTGERERQVGRGGKAVAPDPADPRRAPARIGAQDGDREPTLENRPVRRSKASEEPPVGGAAAQKDVLAVVEHEPVAFERPRRAPEARPRLEKRHLGA